MGRDKYIYLHGFASSPHGGKAEYFRQGFGQLSINLQTPDLNQGDFFNLTLTRQLNFIKAEYFDKISISDTTDKTLTSLPEITLIGSSFGGLTSAILAQGNFKVKRLVLLAPAFQFHRHLSRLLGEAAMQQWQRDGFGLFPHYGENRDLPLSYQFWVDLLQYQNEQFSREIPTLIFHGIHDEVIPIESSRSFASDRPWVKLQELDSDHGLTNVLPQIWQGIQDFCQI